MLRTRKCTGLFTAALLLFFFNKSQVGAVETNVEDILAGHEAMIVRFRTLDTTHQVLGSRDVLNPDATNVEVSTCRWTADRLADVERFRFKTVQNIRPDHPKSRQGNYEILRRATEFRVLMASDWENRETLTPFQQRGIKCWIDPTFGSEPMFRFLRPNEHLMWAFHLAGAGGSQRTLRELVKGSAGAKVSDTSEVNGRPTWKLMFQGTPEMIGAYLSASKDDPSNVTTELVFEVDQTTFNILRYEQQYRNLMTQSAKGVSARSTSVWTTEVTELRELSEGLLVPWRTLLTNVHDGKVIGRTATQFVTAKVNEPLGAEELELKFPEYALVEHCPAVNGKTKVELWGPDDRPLKEIKDEVEDLKEYLHLAPRFADSPASGGRKWFLGLFVGVAVIGGWLGYRRRR